MEVNRQPPGRSQMYASERGQRQELQRTGGESQSVWGNVPRPLASILKKRKWEERKEKSYKKEKRKKLGLREGRGSLLLPGLVVSRVRAIGADRKPVE